MAGPCASSGRFTDPVVTRAVLLTLASCLGAPAAGAQTGWLPRTVDMGPNLTGANRAAALARLESIERLLKQVPELVHPDGFEIRPFFTGHRSRTGPGDTEHADYVVEYQYRINFFVPSLAKKASATGAIIFAVNADENTKGWVDPQGRSIFIEQPRWPPVPFSVATYGVGKLLPGEGFGLWAWFTPGGERPWRAVSREDYYNAVIAYGDGANGEKRAEIDKAAEKTPYQRWLAEAPKRKTDREAILKVLARAQPPGEVAKMRRTLEDVERETGDNLRKSEPADREESQSMSKASDAVRAELNRMTPAQRKLPAIVDTDPAATEWRATGASMRERDTLTATASRVLTPNYDFWRARHSPAEVRTLNVYLEGSPAKPVLNAIYQTVKKFDWRALAALVDQSP